MIPVLFFYYARWQTQEKEEKTERKRVGKKKVERKRRRRLSLFTIIPLVVAIIVFIFTEDMRLPMKLIDEWTIWMFLIAILQAVAALLISMLKKAASTKPPIRPTVAPGR